MQLELTEQERSRLFSSFEQGEPCECWLWRSTLAESGHGLIRIGGKQLRPHRVAWELRSGPIPKGAYVKLSCREARCMNPAHMVLVRTMGKAKADEIRARRRAGEGVRALARSVGTSPRNIHCIITGRTWK